MLKLDIGPNTMPSKHAENDLGGAPNAADGASTTMGRDVDRSMHFVIWPAQVGEKQINVRNSTRQLSRTSGDNFEINSVKITAALQTHRAAIELCANERLKLEPGETEITSAARHQARPHYRDVAGARWRNDCCPYGCDGMATALGSGLSC